MATHRNTLGRVAGATVLVVLTAAAFNDTAPSQLSSRAPTSQDSAEALHLLRRATYGVRSEDISTLLEMGRDAWLDQQLHPERIADDAVAERLEKFSTVSRPMGALIREYAPLPAPARASADSMNGAPMQPDSQYAAAQRKRRQGRARLLNDAVGARLTRAVHGERQLEEVMTEFWFNHFNVYFGKGFDRYFVADYERTAIRPHVFGKFEDMLLATAQHPAMLYYLDNWISVMPDSMNPRVERPRARQRGINENYARELLELHTLGVDGGYTQQDVIEVARALTGWTFRRPNLRAQQAMTAAPPDGRAAAAQNVAFRFRGGVHDAGEKVVLRQTLPAGRGVEDGVDVIRLLANHPSTARHIATKLVERFVSDEPDPALVDELANVFLESGGDLREVTRALFTSERFYDPRYVGAKVKTPYELVASALRVTRAEVTKPDRLIATLRALGNLPFNEPAPTGFPASSEDWVNAGAMMNRMSFGLALATGRFGRVRVDVPALAETEQGRDSVEPEPLRDLLDTLLPGQRAPQLEAAIREDLAGRTKDAPRERLARAVGLTIGSPAFQMR